jgi:peptidyl-prolyl cis-trans isomerase A (cyclophilin A)
VKAEPVQPSAAPDAPAQVPPPEARELDPKLLDPRLASETAPERFTVTFETTRGDLHLDVRRSWAPNGADRMYNLVRAGYFDDTAFFRVVDGFIAQVGISGMPQVNSAWRGARIDDDAVAQSNARGTLSFAAGGKNTRTTQVFINLSDNPQLDGMGFAPIGRIRELDVAQKLYAGYGEGAPSGRGPAQARIQREGNAYLKASFPELDYIKRATVSDEKGSRPAKP